MGEFSDYCRRLVICTLSNSSGHSMCVLGILVSLYHPKRFRFNWLGAACWQGYKHLQVWFLHAARTENQCLTLDRHLPVPLHLKGTAKATLFLLLLEMIGRTRNWQFHPRDSSVLFVPPRRVRLERAPLAQWPASLSQPMLLPAAVLRRRFFSGVEQNICFLR